MEILAERILLHNLGHLTAAEKFNNFQNNFFLDKININQILQLITNKFLNNFFFRKKKEIITNFLRLQQPAG